MSISSLPSVIQTLVDFKTKPEDIILLPANSNPNAKQFVICITRDITPEEEDLLNYYGKCLSYNHDVVNNIELSKITYDYLLVDLREGTDRLYLQKYVLENLDKIHFILLRRSFEGDNGIVFENELVDLPVKQVNKEIFDKLLLMRPIEAPSCMMSFLRRCITVGR